MSKKGGNKTKAVPKAPLVNKGPKKKSARRGERPRRRMVQLTERASEELQRLLRDGLAGPRQGVRLRLDAAGRLAMAIDVPHLGDSVIRRGTAPLLIVDARLADNRLAPRVLDFARHMDARPRGGFVLDWRTPEATGLSPGPS